MSQYIHIFARQNDQFIPLYSESRSNYLYEALEIFAPYEKIRKVTLDRINSAIDYLEEKLDNVDKRISIKRNIITETTKMVNSVEEKVDTVYEYLNEIDDDIEEKNYISAALERLIFIKLIIESMEDSVKYSECAKDLGIYVGIECGDKVSVEDVEN